MKPHRKTPDFSEVFLSLGSNKGDREDTIRKAIAELGGLLQNLRVSGLYETEALDGAGPARFLNAVVVGETAVSPRSLLGLVLEMEEQLGRRRELDRRYAPRRIDIDILLYGSLVLQTRELMIPHPRMHQRAFVLIPLLELEPDAVNPQTGRSFGDSMRNLPDQGVYSYPGAHYNGPAI